MSVFIRPPPQYLTQAQDILNPVCLSDSTAQIINVKTTSLTVLNTTELLMLSLPLSPFNPTGWGSCCTPPTLSLIPLDVSSLHGQCGNRWVSL